MASSSSSNVDWAWLPKNIVDTIANKIGSLQDYIRFGAVSPQWLAVTQENCHTRTQGTNKQLPLLMIPSRDDNNPMSRGLYSLTKPGICETEIPVPYERRCCGSSHGWLITLDLMTAIVNLINPFSERLISLFPPFLGDIIFIDDVNENFRPFGEYYIHKAILSSDPDSVSCSIMVIYGSGRKLATLQIGSDCWTYVAKEFRSFHDIIYYKNQFYVLDVWGRVFTYNAFGVPNTIMEFIAPAHCVLFQIDCKKYIVESPEGDLFQVLRMFYNLPPGDDTLYWTMEFRVLKLLVDSVTNNKSWTDVACLGDCALFLGDNHSMSVVATDFPRCCPNCIYFTDDGTGVLMSHKPYNFTGAYDIGVYNLSDRNVSRFYIPNQDQKRLPPPIWIEPTYNHKVV